jgi:hypothetical protein
LAYWVCRLAGNSILMGGVAAGGCGGFDMGYLPEQDDGASGAVGRSGLEDATQKVARRKRSRLRGQHADGSIDRTAN